MELDLALRPRVQHPVGGRIMVKQADKDQADINKIVGNYRAHGTPLPIRGQEPIYGDFSMGFEYRELLDRVTAAQDDFDALPAAVRKACDNDPAVFIDRVMNAETRDDLVDLGLVEERIPPKAKPSSEPAPEPAAQPAEGSTDAPPPEAPSE